MSSRKLTVAGATTQKTSSADCHVGVLPELYCVLIVGLNFGVMLRRG